MYKFKVGDEVLFSYCDIKGRAVIKRKLDEDFFFVVVKSCSRPALIDHNIYLLAREVTKVIDEQKYQDLFI